MGELTQKTVWKLCIDPKDNMRYLSPDEYRIFFSAIPNPDHAFAFRFLFGTGMKIGEAKRMKIRDIDFEKREMNIRSEDGISRKIRFSCMLKSDILQRIKSKSLKPNNFLGIPTRQRMSVLIKYYGHKANLKNPHDLKTITCRKTHEKYLMAMGLDSDVISSQMGRSVSPASARNVCASFDEENIIKVKSIMGDIF